MAQLGPLSEMQAYRLLEIARWGGTPDRCPHCVTIGRCHFLRPADGTSRRTRTGHASARRVWWCGACRRQFSVLTATVLQGTKIDLRSWVALVSARATGQDRDGQADLGAAVGVTPGTLRHMTARLDAAAAIRCSVPPTADRG